jgi:hypothetical protein
VLQESTSTQTVNKTTSYATGSPVTTGGETRGVTAWGVIDETHQSASANRSWGQSGGGWESASGSSYEESIYEQYDYHSDWSETFDAEGTATTSASAGNEVTGWIDTTYTDWTSWFSGCGSGSGSCSGTSGGGSWTSSWGDSYSETVSYPGFYHAGYSAGGDHRGYIGDDYGGASSSGSGYFMYSLAGPESLLEDDSERDVEFCGRETTNGWEKDLERQGDANAVMLASADATDERFCQLISNTAGTISPEHTYVNAMASEGGSRTGPTAGPGGWTMYVFRYNRPARKIGFGKTVSSAGMSEIIVTAQCDTAPVDGGVRVSAQAQTEQERHVSPGGDPPAVPPTPSTPPSSFEDILQQDPFRYPVPPMEWDLPLDDLRKEVDDLFKDLGEPLFPQLDIYAPLGEPFLPRKRWDELEREQGRLKNPLQIPLGPHGEAEFRPGLPKVDLQKWNPKSLIPPGQVRLELRW